MYNNKRKVTSSDEDDTQIINNQSKKHASKNQNKTNMANANINNSSADYSLQLDEENEAVFKFVGDGLSNFSNPLKLEDELNKHIKNKNITIKKAFINRLNKQLYVIISDKSSIKHLKKFHGRLMRFMQV